MAAWLTFTLLDFNLWLLPGTLHRCLLIFNLGQGKMSVVKELHPFSLEDWGGFLFFLLASSSLSKCFCWVTAVSAQKRDTKFGFVLILGCLSQHFEAYTLHFPLLYLSKALGLSRSRKRKGFQRDVLLWKVQFCSHMWFSWLAALWLKPLL